MAVLMIEQRARKILRIRGYILDSGKVATTGRANELLGGATMTDLSLAIHDGH
ncbi:hypothetical protein GCM10010924_49570 [Rhizobium wenxiniae]|nr:hypothetical protein GCM10010924_49570 [Rhizobium wenxiniae]